MHHEKYQCGRIVAQFFIAAHMLKHLTLKNFVLVETLSIDFAHGLSTITGESGAGKSILLSALGLILGNRASPDVIRPGADKADVCAEFDLHHLPAVQAQLADAELQADEPQQCLVRRVISNQGRSRAFINGIPVTSQFLRSVGDQLVDIHGQNEHIQLADRNVQMHLLDDYAGSRAAADKVAALYRGWQNDLARITQLQASQAASADKKALLTYQLQELDEFDLQASEFAELEQEHKRLSAAHSTLATLQQTLLVLDDLNDLRHHARDVEAVEDNHADLTSGQANMAAALGLLDDASRDLRRYQDSVVIDPQTLANTEARLNTAQDLARKHKVPVQQLASYVDTLRAELQDIDADSSALEELAAAAEEAAQAFAAAAKKLSNKRRKAAPKFARLVTQYMQQLGITQGSFNMSFSDAEGEQGIDRVEFMVTTNPEFPAGALTQIASGGEQTRISLSIQIVAAEHSALPCLILDEADVGVGGTTADTVGRILRELARHTQVICVTHAPQVAALGNHHYRVVKKGNHTDIHQLDDSARIDELARMLAGADINQKTRDYAQSLLAAAVD